MKCLTAGCGYENNKFGYYLKTCNSPGPVLNHEGLFLCYWCANELTDSPRSTGKTVENIMVQRAVNRKL